LALGAVFSAIASVFSAIASVLGAVACAPVRSPFGRRPR
jgi:hypothetical protein